MKPKREKLYVQKTVTEILTIDVQINDLKQVLNKMTLGSMGKA